MWGRTSTVCLALLCLSQPPGTLVARTPPPAPFPQATPSGSDVYSCPMHPDAIAARPGSCPRCGMTLIRLDPFDAREYDVEARTDPATVRHGRPFRLQLTIREPITQAVVRDFATVHDKRYHLFVISQDLEHYAHVHPDQQPDGSWVLALTLPKPGYYKLYSDFLPSGGTPQVVPLPLVTAGYRGDLAASGAALVADSVLRATAGTMTVALAVPIGGFVAGREETFACDLRDRGTGAPVADIEPYLAAWGHTLVMSEDTQAVVHAHPVELVPEGDTTARGGPTITFKALFPKAGRYRLWTQMKRHDNVVTAVFTVDVASPTGR